MAHLNRAAVLSMRHSQFIKVCVESGSENTFSKEFVHHPNDGGSLGVWNSVEYFWYFIWVFDGDGYGVRGGECIQTKDTLQVGHNKLLQKFQLRLHRFDTKVLNVSRETLVQPQVRPPAWCNQIAYEKTKKISNTRRKYIPCRFFSSYYILDLEKTYRTTDEQARDWRQWLSAVC